MPSFGVRSRKALTSCHPDLQLLANIVIRYIDFSVLEGHRDEDRQNQLRAQGLTKLSWPDSKHNQIPSHALDFAPYPTNWNNTEEFVLVAGHFLAISQLLNIPIRWGGDWDRDHDTDDERFRDYGHIELYRPN